MCIGSKLRVLKKCHHIEIIWVVDQWEPEKWFLNFFFFNLPNMFAIFDDFSKLYSVKSSNMAGIHLVLPLSNIE